MSTQDGAMYKEKLFTVHPRTHKKKYTARLPQTWRASEVSRALYRVNVWAA